MGVNIPDSSTALAAGDFERGRARSCRVDNALPAVTGRVCPQETQCEGVCIRGKKGEPVAIGYLERYVADWAAANMPREQPPPRPRPARVAVVGSGPGGPDRRRRTGPHGPRGARLRGAARARRACWSTASPSSACPRPSSTAEVENLQRAGVKIECNVIIGRTSPSTRSREEFDAVFIANGAGLPMFMNVPGENLKGVYSANEYLTRVNLMGA